MKNSEGANAAAQSPAHLSLTRSQVHLEWERLAKAVLSRCHCAATERRGLTLASSLEEARARLTETAEAMELHQAGEGLPLDDLRDVDPHLARLERRGVLDGPALSDLRVNLRAALWLREFISTRKDRLPALLGICSVDPTLADLDDALATAIGFDGNLHDHASPELRKLRHECTNLRARIVGRLEQFIDKHRELLSDSFYTVREGRYVVPVRSDAHDRVPGIVHATSDSGASLFVEPRAVVPQGNRLKMAEGEREREETRILSALSDQVAEHLASVRAAIESLALLDLRDAGARMALELEAAVPQLCPEGVASLRSARHPLLQLDGVDVVPNDLVLEAGHGVVISGPNAGGKTVLLKTLGLFALMARAGLPLPAKASSKLGFFDPILSDLGDEQSTQKNLSTFSAHVQSLATILSQARPGALVLLDEICGGTDPEEGAALACAVVDALCKAGATVLVTTHYEALKAFSLSSERLRNASVGFDIERMAPNFSLTMDVPGASSALRVAARFGIPSSVVEHAQRVLPQQAKDFELLAGKLNAHTRTAKEREEQLTRELAAAKAVRREHETRLARLKEQSRRKLTAEADRLMADLREARETLRVAKATLRDRAASAESLKSAQAALQAVATRAAIGGDLEAARVRPTTDQAVSGATLAEAHVDLAPGDAVYVPHLRSRGTVVEVDPKTRRFRIAAGPIKLWTESDKLKTVVDDSGPQGRANGPRGQPSPSDRQSESGSEPQELRTRDNTLKLKGMRVDDALPMMESFVDRMLMGPDKVGFVVHGHGTGSLRKAIRKHLEQVMTHVTRTRPGTPEEGGDAVTVFYLD